MDLTPLQWALFGKMQRDGVSVGFLKTPPPDLPSDSDGWLQIEADGSSPQLVVRGDMPLSVQGIAHLRKMVRARLERVGLAEETEWDVDGATGRRRVFFGDVSSEIPPELRE